MLILRCSQNVGGQGKLCMVDGEFTVVSQGRVPKPAQYLDSTVTVMYDKFYREMRESTNLAILFYYICITSISVTVRVYRRYCSTKF